MSKPIRRPVGVVGKIGDLRSLRWRPRKGAAPVEIAAPRGTAIYALSDGSILLWPPRGAYLSPPLAAARPATRAIARPGLTVWWPNPPDPRAPLEIEKVFRGRRYRYEVPARGLLTPTEAAAVLASGVGGDPLNKMRVYRLVRAGVLKGVHHGGKGRQLMVTANSLRAYVAKMNAQAPQKGKRPRLLLTG